MNVRIFVEGYFKKHITHHFKVFARLLEAGGGVKSE